MSQEKISDLYVHHIDDEPYVVLSCAENRVKVIKDSELVYTYPLESNVLCMIPYNMRTSKFEKRADMNKDMLLGLSDGKIVQIQINLEEAQTAWSF